MRIPTSRHQTETRGCLQPCFPPSSPPFLSLVSLAWQHPHLPSHPPPHPPLVRFLLPSSLGPYKLDLGNVLYAPCCWRDPQVTEALGTGGRGRGWRGAAPVPETFIISPEIPPHTRGVTRAHSFPHAHSLGSSPPSLPLPQGRLILWAWMKELRRVPPPAALCDKYSYSGCVSLPRALYLRKGRLFQV